RAVDRFRESSFPRRPEALRFDTAADAEQWALRVGPETADPSADAPSEPPPASTSGLSLAALFSRRGLFRGADGAGPSHRTVTRIYVGPETTPAVIDLAARIALEATGL